MNLGLDKYFFDKAKAAGKGVIGLETAEFQIDRFDRTHDLLLHAAFGEFHELVGLRLWNLRDQRRFIGKVLQQAHLIRQDQRHV